MSEGREEKQEAFLGDAEPSYKRRSRLTSVDKTPLVDKKTGERLIEQFNTLILSPETNVADLTKDAFLLRFFLFRAAASNDASSFRYAQELLRLAYPQKGPLPEEQSNSPLPKGLEDRI